MSPTFTYAKRKRIYRYYISNETAAASSGGPLRNAVRFRRVSAGPIEAIVRQRLERFLEAPPGCGWDVLLPQLARIEVLSEAVRIGLRGLSGDLDRLRAKLFVGDTVKPDDNAADQIVITVAVRAVVRGGRAWMVAPTGASAEEPRRVDPALLKALRFAHMWQLKLGASPLTPVDELRTASAAADSYVRRLTPLAFLAPDIQRAIVEGTQPAALNLQHLINTKIPVAWSDQRRAFGFAEKPFSPA